MRIEERGCSMITDEQGMEWLFQKLYDAGWLYIVADNYDNIYLTNEKPLMFDGVDEVRISSCEKAMGASAFKSILPKLNRNECISIAEELGIVDWSKVAVDTPILVSLDDKLWLCRYFANFKNGIVYTWSNGATSWSVRRREHKDAWGYAKLAEV